MNGLTRRFLIKPRLHTQCFDAELQKKTSFPLLLFHRFIQDSRSRNEVSAFAICQSAAARQTAGRRRLLGQHRSRGKVTVQQPELERN